MNLSFEETLHERKKIQGILAQPNGDSIVYALAYQDEVNPEIAFEELEAYGRKQRRTIKGLVIGLIDRSFTR